MKKKREYDPWGSLFVLLVLPFVVVGYVALWNWAWGLL